MKGQGFRSNEIKKSIIICYQARFWNTMAPTWFLCGTQLTWRVTNQKSSQSPSWAWSLQPGTHESFQLDSGGGNAHLKGIFGLWISQRCSSLHASFWWWSLKFMLEKNTKLKICCCVLKKIGQSWEIHLTVQCIVYLK